MNLERKGMSLEGSQAEQGRMVNIQQKKILLHLKTSISIIFCVKCAGQISSQGACTRTLLGHSKLCVFI